MQETEIEIRHCSLCRPIERNEEKYQTNIIATSCIWRENLEVDYTLQMSPSVAQTYIVVLNQPVKFHLNMSLWLFYDCPTAYHNGYENEAEIEQAKFCFGQITNLVSYNELGATVHFSVLKTLTLQEALLELPAKEFPKFWMDFFIGFLDRNDYSYEVLGKYHILSVLAQGDLGQTCIFCKAGNEFFICLVNEWNFSEDGTFGGKYKLPEHIKNKLLT
jgi:hypothetical protein